LNSHTQEIDQIRARIWIAELRAHTGIEAVHSLASFFDPESTWRDENGIPHHSKWYRYQHGTAVPSIALTTKVKSSIPSLEFDTHHPAWTLLRNPMPSPRTLTRIVKNLPRQWTKSMNRLALDSFKHRNICLDLVNRYELSSLGYLDALLLFELARRHAINQHNEKKYENLIFIIQVLPLLYIDDPIWKYQSVTQIKSTVRAIIRSMQLCGYDLREIYFPADRLAQAIAMQRLLAARHTTDHPKALNTKERRIRFLARSLGDATDERYVIATSAFFKERPFYLHKEVIYWDPDRYVKVAWQNAWSAIKHDPVFSHFRPCLSRE
jgi:hypothetical protein